jgi:glycosyltransferase involved in cell wall biosynthesis
MKVLMLNTFDETGGAARAATRLLRGVRQQGIEANLLVQFKTGSAAEVICSSNPLRKLARRLKLFLGMLPVRRYPNRPENNFSAALLPDSLPATVAGIDPDIIHLHWLGASFAQVETLGKLSKPLLWTLHDSWAFTGGCHVPFGCSRYRERCGACPVLGSSSEHDLSRRVWERKEKAWGGLDLTVVTPSRWLAECARSSSLFHDKRIEVIPNGLETAIFQPRPREEARRALGLPQGKKIILFGAVQGTADPNKGFQLLREALRKLGRESYNLLAVVFGTDQAATMPDLGLPLRSLGRINDDQRLSSLYAAADVFVAPSLLENLPNTVMEAMACGTPCVAFRQGGVPDLIEHQVSGYLAVPYEVSDLAQGIAWILKDGERRAGLSSRARQKVRQDFELGRVAGSYAALYRKILA